MAKLTRVTGKVFGSQASPTGDVDNGAYIGQFGSAQAGTYVGTDDVAMIQSLPAWEQGWIGACVEEDQLPPLPERTGVDKVLSYQECYLLQQGMPEWDSATTYYIDNFCSYNGIIYKSLTDINLNNQPDISVANWEVYGKISQYTKFAINKGNNPLLYTNNATLYWKRNVTLVGTLTVTDNTIISGFNTTSAFTLPNDFYPSTGTWESVSKIKITSFTYPMTIMDDAVIGGFNGISLKVATDGRIQAFASSTGASYNIINGLLSTNTLSLNTWYYVKYSYTGTAYRVDVSTTGAFSGEEINFINVPSSTPINYMPFMFGVDSNNQYPFAGEMDLKGFYIKLNGSVWWEGIVQGTSLDYDWIESSGTAVNFNVDNSNPLTYTNIMGNTRTVESLDSIDVSAENDGTYKVVLPESGNQPYLFNNSIFITEKKPEFFIVVGNPTINDSIISDFSASNYIKLPTTFNPQSNPWEIVIKFKTGNSFSAQSIFSRTDNDYYGINIQLTSSANIYLSVASTNSTEIVSLTSTNTLNTNTDYWIKAEFTGSAYKISLSTDGNTYNLENSYSSSTPIFYSMSQTKFGFMTSTALLERVFLGSVDLKECYIKINNNIWWKGKEQTNDVWINPQELYTAKQYDGADWQDFNDVLLLDSFVTISSGVISDLEQPTYNYNGIVVNQTSKTNREFVSIMSMPSDTHQTFTVGASGSQYISPSNGHWRAIGIGAINGNCYIQLKNLSNNDIWYTSTGGAGYGITSSIKVKKGDIIELTYLYVTFQMFYFIPTVGGDN